MIKIYVRSEMFETFEVVLHHYLPTDSQSILLFS